MNSVNPLMSGISMVAVVDICVMVVI